MSYYFIRTGALGSTGDMFKSKDAESAALQAAKRWPRANYLYVWEVVHDKPMRFSPKTDVTVVGVESK